MVLAAFREIIKMKINKSIRNKCYSLGWSDPLCCTWTKPRFAIQLIYKHDRLIDRGVVSDIPSLILENQFYGWACIEKKLVIWKFLILLYKHSAVFWPAGAILLCISEDIWVTCSSAIIPLHLRSLKRSSFLELGQTSFKKVAVLTPVGSSCRGDWAQMSRQMAARHILGSNGPRGQSQEFVAHYRLIWQMSFVYIYLFWALIIHICEELCVCALPGRLEHSHLNDVVILWFISWYRCVQPKGFGVVCCCCFFCCFLLLVLFCGVFFCCCFLFLLCFTSANLKSDGVENFSGLYTGNLWPMKS